MPGSASFIEQDLDTQGSWVARRRGWVCDARRVRLLLLPEYVQYSENGNSYLWQYPTSSSSAVAMQEWDDPNERVASTEYLNGTIAVNLTLTDGQPHQVALYMMDFDNEGRQQTVQVSDADTGAVLDTRTVSNFQDGAWLVWNLQGHVVISITATSGPNAVLSGIMFDPPRQRTGCTDEPFGNRHSQRRAVAMDRQHGFQCGGLQRLSPLVGYRAVHATQHCSATGNHLHRHHSAI